MTVYRTLLAENEKSVVEGELFAADVEGIEDGGAVFEQVFFRFGEFFTGLVLAEAVASTDVCGLDGEDKVFAVRTAEERHQALLPGESFVDEKILLVVAHRVSEIHGLDAPAMPLKLLDDIVVELCGKLMGERRKVRDGRRHTGIAPVAVARLSALSFIRLS